jgi:hypothetical protein
MLKEMDSGERTFRNADTRIPNQAIWMECWKMSGNKNVDCRRMDGADMRKIAETTFCEGFK